MLKHHYEMTMISRLVTSRTTSVINYTVIETSKDYSTTYKHQTISFNEPVNVLRAIATIIQTRSNFKVISMYNKSLTRMIVHIKLDKLIYQFSIHIADKISTQKFDHPVIFDIKFQELYYDLSFYPNDQEKKIKTFISRNYLNQVLQ